MAKDKKSHILELAVGELAKTGIFPDTLRFTPVKRKHLDGKTYWVPWDNRNHRFSTLTCHGLYTTKKSCQFHIDFYGIKGYYK